MIKKGLIGLIVVMFFVWGLLVGSPSLAAEPIKIGMVGPMNFMIGQHILYAAEYAEKEINAAGGIKVGQTRVPVKLIKVDDNSMASVPDSVTAVEKGP
jgi:branched-chain amino acid transport system substrate-binding protein